MKLIVRDDRVQRWLGEDPFAAVRAVQGEVIRQAASARARRRREKWLWFGIFLFAKYL